MIKPPTNRWAARFTLPFPPSPPEISAIDTTEAQLSWGGMPEGRATITVADAGRTVAEELVDHPGGPALLDLDGLPAGRELTFVLRSGDERVELTGRTLTPPPGEELARVATISDLHLGSDHFGYLRTMFDTSDHDEAFALRSAMAAVDAAVAWGAEHLLIKGDAAHHGREADFAMVGRLVDAFPDLAITLLPGNHDVDGREVPAPETVGERRIPYVRGVVPVPVAGLTVLAADTTVAGEGPGTLQTVGDDIVEAAAAATSPVLVAVHQQLQAHDPIRYWPPGIARREAEPFLDRLADAVPDAVVTSGHTHRNRRRYHRGVLVTEVAATHHWPGVWAGYAVHEGGIRQVVRRIEGRGALAWHEYSKDAVWSLWRRWASGSLDDRCLTHRWQRG